MNLVPLSSGSGVYALPWNLSLFVAMLEVTLGHKHTILRRKNIMDLRLVLLRGSFLELSHHTVRKPNQP